MKTALVVRHGALGDAVQTSSVVKGLHDQGYLVDVLAQAPQHVVLENNPYINKLIVLEKDQVQNKDLHEFWSYLGSKYDAWFNLCEVVEGSLLAMPGRTVHWWSPKARETLMNHSYTKMMHQVAGIPDVLQMKVFTTEVEQNRVKRHLGGGLNIFMPLFGSSVHKISGSYVDIIFRLLDTYPEATIHTVGGGDSGPILEEPFADEPRVKKHCGVLSVRDTIALGQQCDIAIGPETGFMNAVACEDLPKVLILSHSTPENYVGWKNTAYAYSSNTRCKGRGDNEAMACHQLHYSWEHCTQALTPGGEESGVAQCQADISVDYLWHLITTLLEERRG
jgi:ADP-heptose:LPS heptosyltransferase